MTIPAPAPIDIRVLIALDSLGDSIEESEVERYRSSVSAEILKHWPHAKSYIDVEQRICTVVLVDAENATEERDIETTVDHLLQTVWDDGDY